MLKTIPRKVAVLATLAIIVALVVSSYQPTGASASSTRSISAKALTDHDCNASEWHAVITQVSDSSKAPASVEFTWSDGDTERVPLEKFTGKTAHYTTKSNLGSTVVSITTDIYSSWSGQFNLSHGPCGNEPSTPPDNPPIQPSCPPGTTGDGKTCIGTATSISRPATPVSAEPVFTG